MDKPVDPQRYEAAKVMRNKLRDECVAFVQRFKKVHKRDPLPRDLEEIRGTVNDFAFQNKKYSLLKAKMVRQGVLPFDPVEEHRKREREELEAQGLAAAVADGANAQDKPVNVTAAGLRRRGTMYGGGFGAKAPGGGGMGATLGAKGFEAFGDPSVRKLKETIQQAERQNEELEEEISRLRYSLREYVGENEIVTALNRELEIKADLIKERDDEIRALIDEKTAIEEEKDAVRKEFEKHKIDALMKKTFREAVVRRKPTRQPAAAMRTSQTAGFLPRAQDSEASRRDSRSRSPRDGASDADGSVASLPPGQSLLPAASVEQGRDSGFVS